MMASKYLYAFFLIAVCAAFPLQSIAQASGYNKGFQFSTLASFDQYAISHQINDGPTYHYRSSERFPNDFNLAYQFGLINRKKFWHQTTLNFTYFGKFTRTYTEYSPDQTNWTPLPHLVQFDQEIYFLDLGKNFKINLFDHKLYATLGFGAGGGIIRWPGAMEDGDLFFFAGQVWPAAGIELKLLKWLGVFGEMRYHYGISETITQTLAGESNQWQYRLQGEELKLGVSIYYTAD